MHWNTRCWCYDYYFITALPAFRLFRVLSLLSNNCLYYSECFVCSASLWSFLNPFKITFCFRLSASGVMSVLLVQRLFGRQRRSLNPYRHSDNDSWLTNTHPTRAQKNERQTKQATTQPQHKRMKNKHFLFWDRMVKILVLYETKHWCFPVLEPNLSLIV